MALSLDLNRTAGAEISDDAESLRRIQAWADNTDERVTGVENDNSLGSLETIGATQTNAFSLTTAMAGTTIPCSKSSEIVVTIPTNANQPFDIGARVKLLQIGAGDVRVVADEGVTIDYTGDRFGRTRQQWGSLALLQLDTDHWIIGGDLDYSVQDIAAAGAIDLYADHVRITGPASSTYAVTLAAPSIGGRVKVIEMVATTATNAVTLALTNVVGGTSSSSASFDAVGETLVLVSAKLKWVVLKQQGVTLS